MMVDHKAAALQELRSERNALVGKRSELRAELDQVEARVIQLDSVIGPLEALVDGITSSPVTQDPIVNVVAGGDGTGTRSGAVPETDDRQAATTGEEPVGGEGRHNVPELFKRYLPRGGEGKRLRSTLMVSDLVDMLNEPVTKDALRRQFFDHFGRDNLARYWDRPENALNTAITRAVEEDLIIEVPGVDGRPNLFVGHFRNSETGDPAMPAIHVEEGN